jgi:hypothetical protein
MEARLKSGCGGAMTMQITIEVPDSLGQQLQPFQERLAEILERGLREFTAEQTIAYQDEEAIMELLTSAPAPEQVLAIRASPALDQRVSELLARSKEGQLSRAEEREFDRIMMLEHLVRMAKAHALKQISAGR